MMLLMEKKKSKTKPVSPEEKRFNDEFGERVRDRKLQKGLSSEKLAELAEISTQHLSNIENGHLRRGVSLSVGFRLARALGETIEGLVGTEIVVDEDTAFEMMQRARERKRLRQT